METRICYSTDLYAESRHYYESVLGWTVYSEWDRSLTDKGVIYLAAAITATALRTVLPVALTASSA